MKQENRMDGMNCLNILSIIVPQVTLARVLVPRAYASMGVEITTLSDRECYKQLLCQ